MANRFLSNIRINDAYTFPASDGNNGQAIITDGSGNLSFGDVLSDSEAASVIYRDNFTGDGTTVAFALQNSLSGEDQTFIYIDGVYQEKDTYSLSTNTITFTTAPASGDSVEVISISGVSIGPTIIYQDNFTGNGSTTDFTLAQSVDNEIKTMIYFNGVYQFKGTYSLNGDVITFATAPANGVEIEVITIASAAAEDFNQKLLFYGKANEAISKGDAVMFAGQEGDHFLFAKATQTAIAANHEYFIGLASQDLVTGEFGYVTEFGNVSAIDTSSYNAGDILWFDAGGTTAGALTTTEPAAPLVKIQVAAVIRSHQNEGVIFVRPTWYHELRELHDVNVTSIADKDILVWDNANGYWKNSKTLGDITTGVTTFSQGATSIPVGGISHYANNYLYIKGGAAGAAIGNDDFSGAVYIADNSDITFTTSNSDAVVIKASGNVGIGAVPTRTLQVHEASATSSAIKISNSTTGAAINDGFDLVVDSVGNAYVAQKEALPLIFLTSDSEKMRVDSSGNVGIGNTNPAAYGKFVVNGAGSIININATSGKSRLGFYENGVGRFYIDTLNGSDGIAFVDGDGSSERMRINSSGNVGIGVTPSAWSFTALQIKNSAFWSTGSDLGVNANSYYDGSAYRYVANGGASRVYHNTDGSIAWSNAPSGTAGNAITFEERMRIDSSGNVGINCSPNSKLQVVGSVQDQIRFGSNTSVYTDLWMGTGYAVFDSIGGNSGAFDFRDDGVSRMFIDSSGNVGIGTTNPSVKLDVYKGSSGVVANFNGVNAYGAETGIELSQGRAKISGFLNTSGGTPGSNLRFYTMPNSGSVTERMRITSGGAVYVGNHNGDLNTNNGFVFESNGFMKATRNFSTTGEIMVLNQRDGQGTTQVDFRNGNVERGRIEWTTSGTTYNTTSDYRIKENINELTGCLEKVDLLKPKTFNYIDGNGSIVSGFIAHEVQEVVPEAVSGNKDDVREDGTPKYQGMDHSRLVPILVGAIKELKAEIELLKSQING